VSRIEAGLSDAIGCQKARAYFLADFETIRDDFASLDDCLSSRRRLGQHRNVSLKALSLASPAHVTWARTRPDANPSEVCPKELVGTRIVLMVVQETGDPRLQLSSVT
jgi:hypothetical protein